MTDTADLEQRLHKAARWLEGFVVGSLGLPAGMSADRHAKTLDEAREALSSLTRKLEEARAVLEPFAAALPQGYETRFDGPQGAARYAAITTVELRPRHFAQAVNFLSSADADVVTDQGEK